METMVSPNKPSKKDGGKKNGGSGGSTSTHKSLITRNLRKAYDEVAGEPIPDRILELLQQIDETEKGGK